MLSSTDLISEITFTTARSSGPGGQSVNKVESKVYLRFDVKNSKILTGDQKLLLFFKLSSRINKMGVLILSSQSGRSQLENKERVLARLDSLFKKAFAIQKRRKKSKPSKGSVERRLKKKKVLKEKKERRKNPPSI